MNQPAKAPDTYAQCLSRVRNEAQRRLIAGPRCHGWDHTLRVLHNARHLAKAEHADPSVVEFAALLHDIGRAEEDATEGATCHAELGAKRTPELLRRAGVEDEDFIARVTECVRTHRYRSRSKEAPMTPEAKVVFDADKLDSIGAIGIGRAFHFAGRIGACIHNKEDAAMASESYSDEDSAYREYLVKLRHLHDSMLTDAGKRMANRRHSFMVEFFERLNEEVEGEDY